MRQENKFNSLKGIFTSYNVPLLPPIHVKGKKGKVFPTLLFSSLFPQAIFPILLSLSFLVLHDFVISDAYFYWCHESHKLSGAALDLTLFGANFLVGREMEVGTQN